MLFETAAVALPCIRVLLEQFVAKGLARGLESFSNSLFGPLGLSNSDLFLIILYLYPHLLFNGAL